MDDKSKTDKERLGEVSDPLARAIIDAGNKWCEREYGSRGLDSSSPSVFFSVLSKENEQSYICLGGNVNRLTHAMISCADQNPFFADLLTGITASLIYLGDISENTLMSLVRSLREDDAHDVPVNPNTIVS